MRKVYLILAILLMSVSAHAGWITLRDTNKVEIGTSGNPLKVSLAPGATGPDNIIEGNTSAEVVDTGSDGHFKVTTEGTERLRVLANGNVGIGTSAPSAELEVVGELLVSGGETSSLGIGTTAPSSELEVVGTATMTGFKMVTGASNGYVLTSDADGVGTWEESTGGASQWTDEASDAIAYSAGNVGLGTTAPTQQLELTGSLKLPTTTTTTTGVIYKGSDRFIHNFQHPTGDSATPQGFNTFVGVRAGNLTTGSGATSIIHASYNTGIAYNALEDITNGYNNTAVGYEAGKNITTGNNNVALGAQALYTNLTGNDNFAIGYQALYRNTASGNVGLGFQALKENTTGITNTGIGYQALYTNTTGLGNIGIGQKSLYLLESGQFNMASGNSSLYALTNGSYNIGLGDNSGRYIADGSTANTTSDYSIFLGPKTKASADNVQNEIVIGYDAIGSGSNSVTLGATTITDTKLRGLVEVTGTAGLRVTPPAAQTIAAGNTVTANACGSIKKITAAGAVTTDTTDTFTAPAAANDSCCMDVINVGGENITLDNNANFVSAGAADVVLGAGDTVRVCSTGASGKWYQIGATGNN